MRIFISWSGNRSKTVATALKEWLPDVFQGLHIWMSDHDIDAGSRWGNEINNELESSNFGILCLTPENLSAPWILFEAGALAKAVRAARVIPYRLHLKPTDVEMPLAQFQGVDADKLGTFKLLQSINDGLDPALPPDRLDRVFEKWWPDLLEKLNSIPLVADDKNPQRSQQALLEEILQLVRSQQRQLAILNPVTLMGLNTSAEELAAMSLKELKLHHNKLINLYASSESQSEQYLVHLELKRISDELQRRSNTSGPNKTEGDSEPNVEA